MFETQCLVVGAGGVDGSNYNSSLVANVLPRDTSLFAGAFAILEMGIE